MHNDPAQTTIRQIGEALGAAGRTGINLGGAELTLDRPFPDAVTGPFTNAQQGLDLMFRDNDLEQTLRSLTVEHLESLIEATQVIAGEHAVRQQHARGMENTIRRILGRASEYGEAVKADAAGPEHGPR